MKWNPIQVFILSVLIFSPSLVAAKVTGTVSAGGGYLAHPLGISGDEAASYATQSLRLQFTSESGSSTWKLGYEGSIHQFDGEQPLDQMWHSLGLEWFGPDERSRWKLSSGLQMSTRSQSDYYEPYNYYETSGYFAFRTYLRDGLLLRGYSQLRYRNYGDLPEESFLEPFAQVELQRFLPSRTTLGATLDWGWKAYSDPVAERVWETDGMPTTSLLQMRFNVAQSLSERTSVRASVLQRWSLLEFPHIAQEDLFDSPILDAYASRGTQATMTLRVLGPRQIWLEPALSYADWDYGESLFPGPDGAVSRRDEIFRGSVAFERRFTSVADAQLKVRLVVSWREQRSSLDTYDLSGPDFSTGLGWSW